MLRPLGSNIEFGHEKHEEKKGFHHKPLRVSVPPWQDNLLFFSK